MRPDVARLDDATAVYIASRAALREVTGFNFHGGHLALGERAPEPALDDLLAPAGDRAVVVMERLANPDNVGGVLRNAAAFGAAAALPRPAAPTRSTAARSASRWAARWWFPSRRSRTGRATSTRLRAAGYTLVALTPARGRHGHRARQARRVAILVGHESDGLGAPALA